MSLFHTGFSVDAAVPVASTSTTAHPAAGSVHKKRKRNNEDESNSNDDKNSSKANIDSGANTSSVVPSSSTNVPVMKPKSTISATSINNDVDMSVLSGQGQQQSTETVVNIEKLMKKLQRMEKGGKAEEDNSAKNKNKKQKVQAQSTPARGSNSIITPKTDNGKFKDQTQNGTAKPTKNKKKAKKDAAADKPEYIPDAEALAKREARQKKKETRAASGDQKKPVSNDGQSEANATSEMVPEMEDVSTMDIDTLEQVAQSTIATTAEPVETVIETESVAVAVPPTPAKTPKQKKSKKNAQPEIQAETEAEAEPSIKAAPPVPASAVKIVASVPAPSVKAAALTPVPAVKAATPVQAPPPSVKSVDSTGMTDLQKKMQKKLGGARFRWINEQLYTTSGIDALQLMEEDPAMFEDYHNGFASQATSWPTQPIHLFIDHFKRTYSKPSSSKPIIADLGCGKAEIAKTLVPLGFTVLSYDLVEEEPYIVKAQCTKRLPLPGLTSSVKEDTAEGAVVDCVVCCLSLMGSDWLGMIKEARRVMKMGGKLKIAEVTSRFTDVKDFIQLVNAIGFKLSSKDESNTHFILFDFEKIPLQTCKSTMQSLSDMEKTTLSQDLLKPCIYKRR